MREISPAKNLSAEEYYDELSPEMQALVDRIKAEKIRAELKQSQRPKPSDSLIDESQLLNAKKRIAILDRVAILVDESLFGRSDMCQQFTDLLAKALRYFGLPARPVFGEAIYYDEQKREMFRWEHAWVCIDDEVVDGNTDILFENPCVPREVSVRPYWGPIKQTPSDRKLYASDRRLREKYRKPFPSGEDVEKIWWPELQAWLMISYPQ